MLVDEIANGLLELLGAAEDAAFDRTVGQKCELALDLVQSRAAGRDEVEMKSPVALEPPLDFRGRVWRSCP